MLKTKQIFDCAYIFVNPKDSANTVDYKKIENTVQEKCAVKKAELYFQPKNFVVHEIYNAMRENKIIMDYYNTFYEGDFLGKSDFDDTLYKLNLCHKAYLLNYDRVLFIDLTTPNMFLTNNEETFSWIWRNFPDGIDGFVYFNYSGKPNIIKSKINHCYYDVDVTTSLKTINVFSISKLAIKNMLDNQRMVLKRFEYYLQHRNMAYDSLVSHIALNTWDK